MLDSFLVAFNAVGPFLVLLGIGFAAVRMKWTDRPFMDRLNALNYKLFFPFLMFNNVYSAKPELMPSVKLIITGVVSVSLLVVFLMIIVPKIVKENPRRGVIIQGIFRSNFIIYGIPLTTYVFGEEKSSICGMMIMIMVSLFNIAGVIVLESFRDGGKIQPKQLLLGIIKNPLLQGCVVGLVFYLLQIRLPPFIATPVSSLASLATTLALVVLGANLKFDELKKKPPDNQHCVTHPADPAPHCNGRLCVFHRFAGCGAVPDPDDLRHTCRRVFLSYGPEHGG